MDPPAGPPPVFFLKLSSVDLGTRELFAEQSFRVWSFRVSGRASATDLDDNRVIQPGY